MFDCLKSWQNRIELVGLFVASVALYQFQSIFPITLGPDWLLAGAYGVALVAAFIQGYQGALVFALGGLTGWLYSGATTLTGLSTLASIAESFAVAYLFQYRFQSIANLEHPRDVFVLTIVVACASIVRGFVVYLGASLLIETSNESNLALGAAVLEWFSTLIIAPFMLYWLRGRIFNWCAPHRYLEGFILAILTVTITWIWFGGAYPKPMNHPIPMLAVLLGVGNWVAFRFYVRGMVTFILVVGAILTLGAAIRGTFAPVIPLNEPPAEQFLWISSMGAIIVFHLVIASVAKDYAIRERERDTLMLSVQKHAERLGEVNSRLSLQALEIADQAEELQRQRDEFERLAKELSTKQARLQLLESAVVNAQDAIIVLEATPQPGRGRSVLYVNDAFTRMMGYTAEEVIGRSLHFLRGEKTDPETLRNMRNALDECRPFNCELLNYRSNGMGVWVSLSIVPVLNSNGECSHFVMIQHDITDRKVAEEALLASEAKFRGIFETASAGVSITDANGIFISCNPAFANMVGLTPEEVIGRHPIDFTHPDDWKAQNGFQEALQEGKIDHYQLRKRYIRPDGSCTWTELSLAAVRNAEGKFHAGLGISVDISARVNLEDQLRQSQKMEALGQLAGGIAHDFNNLLTAVLGNLALVKLADGDPAAQLLKTVERAASRAADLTRKLLGYARRNQLLVSPILPSVLIGEVIDILRRTIDPRIEIVMDIRSEEPVSVDATLLNQALFNLCLNARDAMPNGGTLTLAAEKCEIEQGQVSIPEDVQSGRYMKITVTDTGLGMDTLVKQRLFEPFFTTKGVGRGTGLGLPMVHGILKQHGGWVSFDSELGRGTQFQLYLPLMQDPASLPPSRLGTTPSCDMNTPPPVKTNSATVLLVDDEEMIRVLGRTILETNGFRVLEAADGQQAVEQFSDKSSEIDLVILDVTMPRLSGRDAFGQIISMKPTARVLFSSGYSTEDLSDIEGSLGMLNKPYRPNDLLNAVDRALRNIPVSSGVNEPVISS